MENQNVGNGNNLLTGTNNFTSLFKHHGNQCLKFHLFPFLNVPDRTALRGTCQIIKKNIPVPKYSYCRLKEGEYRARIETNIGCVETWQHPHPVSNCGPPSRSPEINCELQSDVKAIYPTSGAFAALKKNGRVITWGNPERGGDSSSVTLNLQSNVKTMFSTLFAFAALKKNGKVITWGSPELGGDSSSVTLDLQSNVKTISSTFAAFAALKTNGRVITWGHPDCGGDSSSVHSDLQSYVKTLLCTGYAFAVLKTNGSVITWGCLRSGGDSSSVSEFLQNEVIHIEAVGPQTFRATELK